MEPRVLLVTPATTQAARDCPAHRGSPDRKDSRGKWGGRQKCPDP